MFFLKTANLDERTTLLEHLKSKDILASLPHYVPLHTATAGERYSRFHGTDCFTTRESERLIRLPLWYGLPREQQAFVIDAINEFYA